MNINWKDRPRDRPPPVIFKIFLSKFLFEYKNDVSQPSIAHYSCYVLIILTFSESPKHNLTENRNWRFWSLKINNISWHRHNNYSLARGHRSGIRDKNYKLDQSDLIFAYLVVPWPAFRDINLRSLGLIINTST